MSEKHTPGPWTLDNYGYPTINATPPKGHMKICDVRGWGHLTGAGAMNLPAERAAEIQDANARLISAAPDLLEALRLVWGMFDDGRIVRNIVNDGKPDWALKMLTFTKELQTIQSAIAKAESR